MTDRLRIVQVGDVAHVAPAITAALGDRVDLVNVPLRQVAAGRRGFVKVLSAPTRLADAAMTARAVRALSPHVVHVHWVPNGVIGPLVGRPWVLHAHGSDLRELNVWRRLAFGPILRLADAIVVSTPDLLAFAPSGAEVVPTPVAKPLVPVEDRWDVLVASVARPEKGSSTAFEALRRLAAQRPGLRLAAHDGPAFESGPWERLLLAPQQIFHERLASTQLVLGQFSIGALGVADLEAMALARPLLTWVRDGLYADAPPLISSRDPVILADHALRLIDSDLARHALGAAAATWVARTHDPERIAAQLLALYRRLER